MSGPFGVRRPLRFLARRLELDENQVAELAGVIDDLKTERAQAAVDDRRAQKGFVEAVLSDEFDLSKATGAADQRAQSAERVQKAVIDALSKIHAVLSPEQRQRLATLIRTGALQF